MSKKTLGLSIIVKDEEHVIERMLKTVYPILDYYTIVDTGSTDNTKEVIKKFFDEKGIPGQILDRPFDNFENSRNYAMEMAKGKTDYAMWIDADEELIISDKFDKNKLDKDLYMINTNIGAMKYTRNEIWNTFKNFAWYGPVHEFIVPKEEGITSGLAEGLAVNVHMDGGSWKADVATKYLKHAHELEKYIVENRDPRWLFYTAQSWHDSAVTKSKKENDERLRRSLNFYQERVNNSNGYHEERYYSQLRVGVIKKMIGTYPWSEVQQELLKAYAMDPLRGESFKFIIEHYQALGEWNLAYIYSKMAYDNFHKKTPYPQRLLFVDQMTYQWKFAELLFNSAANTSRIDVAQEIGAELLNIINDPTTTMNDNDKNKITNNVNKILSLKIKKEPTVVKEYEKLKLK